MLPKKPVRLQLGELLAADATTLAPAALENIVTLLAADFALDEDTLVGSLTAATFTGSTPLDCGLGTQNVGIDPATGEQQITLLSPVGGWRWECTAAPGAPETIYGAMLTNSTGATLLALHKLATPIVVQAVADEVQLGTLKLTIASQPIS